MTSAQEQVDVVRQRLTVRDCAGCTACCTWIAVHELGKEPAQRCSFEVLGGCGVYADRPPTCAGFYCLHRAGWGHDDDLPRQAGWLICQADPLRGGERLALQIWRETDQLDNDTLDRMRAQLIDFLDHTTELCTLTWLVITDAESTAAGNWAIDIVRLPPRVFRALVRWTITLARSDDGQRMAHEPLQELRLETTAAVFDQLPPEDLAAFEDPALRDLLS